MTLALYGKSRRRQGLLVVLAFFAVFVAVVAGTAVQPEQRASAVAKPNVLAGVYNFNGHATDNNAPGGNDVVGWEDVLGTSSDDAVRERGSGNPAVRLRSGGGIILGLNTTGYQNIRIEYSWAADTDNDGGSDDGDLLVQWRVGNAGGWTTAATHDLPNNADQSLAAAADLDLAAGASNLTLLQVRFLGDTDEDNDQVFVDNIRISADSLVPQVDTDGDGVFDASDLCAGTLPGAGGINAQGCDWSQQLQGGVAANPVRPNQCSQDFAIVLDKSASFTEGDLTTANTAAKNFVTQMLAVDPSATFRVAAFGETAALKLASSSNLAAIHAAIDDNSGVGIYTNWAAGISTGDAATIDWMIVLTDGNPNRPGTTGSAVHLNALEQARNAANVVKGHAHITVVGIDTSGSPPAGFNNVSRSYALLVGGDGPGNVANGPLDAGYGPNTDVVVGAIGGLDSILQQIAASCTPTIQKVKVNPASVYGVGKAEWELRFTNPSGSTRQYSIVEEAGVTFESVTGGSCSVPAALPGAGPNATCTVNGGTPQNPTTMVVKVSKPWPSQQCSAETLNNSATITGVGAPAGPVGGTSATAYEVPADPTLEECNGTIYVHKDQQGSFADPVWFFSLNNDGNTTKSINGSGTKSWTGVTPGQYNVVEATATNAVCSPNSPAGSFETFVGTGATLEAAQTAAQLNQTNGTAGSATELLQVGAGTVHHAYFINKPCARPDVTIEKTRNGPATIQVGTDVSFNIKVTNLGPGTATGVVVTDNLNPKVTWNEPVDPAGWDCGIAGGTLTCSVASLAEGAGNAVNITLTGSTTMSNPNSCGVVNNTAVVSATNEDPAKDGDAQPGPNSSFATVTVLCPDLSLSKTSLPTDEVTIGDNVVFRIEISNSGDGAATNFSLSDQLPTATGLVWQNPPVLNSLGDGSCSIDGNGLLTCSGLDLGVAQFGYGTIFVTATTSTATTRAVCGVHQNVVATATVNGVAFSSSSAATTVNCPTVTISKSANPAGSVYSGAGIGFDLVISNDTGYAATGVTVTDTLPVVPGVTWSTPTPGCSIGGDQNNELSCTFNVAANSQATVEINGTTTLGVTCGLVTNPGATATLLGTPANSGPAEVLVNCPDPKVEKVGTPPVTVGDNLVFTITVTPQGTGTQNVTLTDTLTGTGLTWTIGGDTTGVGNCVPGTLQSGETLSCTWNNLVSPKTITLTAASTTAMCGGPALSNRADITSAGDVNASNNFSVASIAVHCPNVTLTKALADGQAATVNAGDDISFTITATNNGLGEARGFVLLDNLDPDINGWQITAQSNAGLCVIDATGGPGGTPRLECPTQPGSGTTLAANGGSISVTIKGTTTPAACGTVTNTVTATSTNHPGDIAQKSAEVQVRCPDVGVTKVANPSTINAGANAVFNITVDNFGTGVAYAVVLTDVLRGTGLTWNVAAPDGVTCTSTGPSSAIHLSGETLTCDIGDLAGDAAAIVITISAATSAPDSCGPIENTATVGAKNEDTETDQYANTSTDTVNVNCANIEFVKSTTTPVVSATDPISFTITVTNNGDGTAFNVVVTDTLPGTGLVWTLGGADAASCTTPGGAPHNSGEVLTCSFGDMAKNAVKTVTLNTTTTVGTCPEIENIAELTSNNAGTGRSSVKVTVNCPNITVEKTSTGPDPVDAGGDLFYDIAVAISGPAGTVAKNVVLKEEVPANTSGWAIVSITGDALQNGTCTQILNSIICDFGNLTIPADGQLDYLIKLSAKAIGANGAVTCGGNGLTNWAIVQAGNATEDRDDANVDVNCPDVDVTKVAFDASITAGEDASYTIEVKNNGGGKATAVTLEDELPAGLSWSVTPLAEPAPGEGCWILLGKLYCQFAELAPGASVEIKLTASTMNSEQAAPAVCGPVVNELVEVFVGNDGITGPADTVEDVRIEVDCPDITVEKTPDAGGIGATVSAGEDATFVISVINPGPGTATNVTLSDQLPLAADLDWALVPANTPSECSIDANDLLECQWDSITSGLAVNITVRASTSPAICSSIEGGLSVELDNTATVAASNEVPNGERPNTDTGEIVVNCPDVQVEKSADDDTIGYFDTATFYIDVWNNGPGVATGIKVVDTLPAGSWNTTDEDCDVVPGEGDAPDTIECEFDELVAPDGDVLVKHRITIFSTTEGGVQVCGELENSVAVSAGNEPDSANDNNSDTTTINVECGTIQVIKIDQVPGTTPNKPAAWDFIVTGPNGFSEPVSIAGSGSETIVGVPLGVGYMVEEDQVGMAQCPTTPSPATWTTSVSPSATQDLVEANTTITFTFTNAPCGEVLDTGALIIEKVRDVNGNGVKDAEDTMLSNWPVTISGPQFNVPLQATTNAQGIIFLPAIESGTYTITEGAGADYAIVGVRTNGGALSVSNTTQVEIVFGDDDTVTFYNQPRGSIVVTKSTIVSVNNATPVAAPNDDDGWQITLSSVQCGINVTQATGQNGTTTFSNLPLCSDYRVSENPVNPSSPGYQPVGSTVQTNVTPGHPTALNVTFVNRLDIFDGCTNIADCPQPTPATSTPTATNTPAATPTNTPESTPTATPTPEETVEGVRTPGAGSPTPQAPDTGAGLLGGPVGGVNLMLVVAGFAALATGMAFVGLGRRSRGNNRQA